MTKIKNDILDKLSIKTSDDKYHKWIDTEIINVLPLTYTPNHFDSDVENNTKDYIKCMCYMNEYFEKNNIKTYNVFPLKHKIYNNYIKINTSALIDIFYDIKFNGEPKIKFFSHAGDNVVQEFVWNSVFKFKNSNGRYIYRRPGFKFNYEIETDGYAVSLNFINNNKTGDKEKKKNNFKKKRKEKNAIKETVKDKVKKVLLSELEKQLKIDKNIPENQDMSSDTKFQKLVTKSFNKNIKNKTFKDDYKKKVDDEYTIIKNKTDKTKKENDKLQTETMKKIIKDKKDKKKETIKKEKENGTYETYKLTEDIRLNNLSEFPYIDLVLKDKVKKEEITKKYKDGKIVVVDPGKRSIFYMKSLTDKPYTEEDKKKDIEKGGYKPISGEVNNFGVSKWNGDKILNYTGNTRAHFTKRKYHNKLINKWKTNLNDNTIPKNLSVESNKWYSKTLKDIETEMTFFTCKSSNHDTYLNYVTKRLEYLKKAELQYDTTRMQQLKWYSYINKRRHETKLIDAIKKTFGKDIIIIMGDWSGKGRAKYMPTPNISLKRTLAHEFKIYHIDEFKTSKIYHKSDVECNNLYVPQSTYKVKTKNIDSPKNKSVTKPNIIYTNDKNILSENKINVTVKSYNKPKNKKSKRKKLTDKSIKQENLNTIIETNNKKLTVNTKQQELKILNISKSNSDELPILNTLTDPKHTLRKIHAVLTYKIVKVDMACPSVSGCINRDKNAVYGMSNIFLGHLNDDTRPIQYTRTLNIGHDNIVNVNDVSIDIIKNNINTDHVEESKPSNLKTKQKKSRQVTKQQELPDKKIRKPRITKSITHKNENKCQKDTML
jgi:hypothetical protein